MNTSQHTIAPEEEFDFTDTNRGTDWRILLGIVVTIGWILILSIYIASSVGWAQIGKVPIDILGSFLEGSFAPLAFLWFVLAYFSQQKELAQNTEAIRMQSLQMQRSAEQAEIQAAASRESELHARRESFLRVSEVVREQLGSIAGMLYISSQGMTANDNNPNARLSELWAAMNRNDPEIFSRQLMELSYLTNESYTYKLFYGTPIRTRHTEKFIFNFERLLSGAEECDSNGMIHDALDGTAHGSLYHRMLEYKHNPPRGFTYGQYDFDPDDRSPYGDTN